MGKMKFTKRKAISLDKDFEEILDKFERITKKDKKIKASIPELHRKKIEKTGLFSHSIKYLIKDYVDLNWENYCAIMGVKKTNESKV